MNADVGLLTGILDLFINAVGLGGPGVRANALDLMAILVVIELTLAGLFWALRGEAFVAPLFRKLLFIGFLLLAVQSFPLLANTVLRGFVATGLDAGGGGVIQLRDPSAIIGLGFAATAPIAAYIQDLSALAVMASLVSVSLLGIAMLFTLLAFAVIGLQVFVTYLEFLIVTALGVILIPFGVLKPTAFIAEKVFGAIVAFGVKLMVLAFIIAVAGPILAAIVAAFPPEPTWNQAFNLMIGSLALAALAWHAPSVAAGLLAGSPTFSAGTAVGAGVAAGAGLYAAGVAGAATMANAKQAASTGAQRTLRAAGFVSGAAGTGSVRQKAGSVARAAGLRAKAGLTARSRQAFRAGRLSGRLAADGNHARPINRDYRGRPRSVGEGVVAAQTAANAARSPSPQSGATVKLPEDDKE